MWLTSLREDVERGFFDTPMWLSVLGGLRGKDDSCPAAPAADAMPGGGCHWHFCLPPLGRAVVFPG